MPAPLRSVSDGDPITGRASPDRRRDALRHALREGGSLPALIEADDDGIYVVKFRGAGQGPKALVAEWSAASSPGAGPAGAGDRGRRGGPGLGNAEPDQEIQDLLDASGGLEPRARLPARSARLRPGAPAGVDPEFAADVVWFDASSMNLDRTPQNTNMLVWHGRTWLIDHGAALYVHHTWRDADEHARRPFERIKDHVLLPYAGSIEAADARLAPLLDEAAIHDVVEQVPEVWLRATRRSVGPPPSDGRTSATCCAAWRRRARSSRRPSVRRTA